MSVIGTIGIDLGGNSTVIAAAKRGGIEILSNEASNRETRVMVGFKEDERCIGEQAFAQIKSNFKNTIIFPNRFLGINPDASFLEEEKKWLYTPLILTEDKKLGFEVTIQGQKQVLKPEQVVAMILKKAKQIALNEGIVNDNMVISVPSYYTEQERKALMDAAKIAQVNPLKLMNESTAIALDYGIFRKNDLTPTPRYVCFVDLGHCSASAFLASFTNEKLNIVSQVHERNLGTRDFDWTLLEFYANIISTKYQTNILANDKIRLRFLDAIEKQRKVLSANTDATINVDCITEDQDFSYNLTREQFEEIISPVIYQLKTMLLKLKYEIKVPIHSVEIVGGGTRIPIIQKLIQQIYGNPCSKTLNSSESIAKGCAIKAAQMSPPFKVTPYNIEETNYYPIKCSWNFLGDSRRMDIEKNNPKRNSAILFPKGGPMPDSKEITFNENSYVELNISYAEPVPKGVDPVLAHYIIQPKKLHHNEGLKVKVNLNLNGIVEFNNAILFEKPIPERSYEESIPRGGFFNQNMDSFFGSGFGLDSFGHQSRTPKHRPSTMSQKREKMQVERQPGENLNINVSNFHYLNADQINQYLDLEGKLDLQDKINTETFEKKNELESFVYDTRGKLSDKYEAFPPTIKENLLNELNELENWLYGEGAKARKENYLAKMEGLRIRINAFEKEFSQVTEAK